MSEPASQVTRILVVDDIQQNRELLQRRLSKRGFSVETAEDGPAALVGLANQTFDVVLLDLRMPGMDGIEVLVKIRESWSKAELPVLMVTAESGSDEVVQALTAGANDYVTKPVNVPVMLARMQAHLDIQQEVRAKQSTPEVVVARGGVLQKGFVLDGRYEVVRQLARGGFATVYKALQLSTKRHVAIKLLDLSRLYDPRLAAQEIARFEQEMHLIGKIQHPHLVQLIDSGALRVAGGVDAYESEPADSSSSMDLLETAAQPTPAGATVSTDSSGQATPDGAGGSVPDMAPYIVMELLEGETLDSRLGRVKVMGLQELVDVMLPVIDAVSTAHLEGVIHRDLKPPNIFLHRGPKGEVEPRVVDFGIAKLMGPQAMDLTVTASLVGTPYYMSPEQAMGDQPVGAQTDQYSLGVVMYECLTGRRPCVSDSMIKVLHMVATGDWDPPRQHNADIPAGMQEVLLRAMSLKPEERYEGMASLGRALLPWASAKIRGRWDRELH